MGEQMHAVHNGSRQAPPLLLIHGSGASGASWGPMVDFLAQRHRVIRVDLPGCGQSPPAPSYAVPEQARRVAEILDDLALNHVAVAGHSSGGYVGAALAEQRPDLVRTLTLISSGPSLDALKPQPLVLRALLAPPFGPLLWPRRSDALIRKGIRATAVRPIDIPDDAVADLENITYRTFRKVLRGSRDYLVERSIPDRLGGIPALVIFGADDPRYEPSSARRYKTARVEMLPGVGHLPPLEAPERTSRILLDFVATAAAWTGIRARTRVDLGGRGRRRATPGLPAAGRQHGRLPAADARARGHRHGRAPVRHADLRPERRRRHRPPRRRRAADRRLRRRAAAGAAPDRATPGRQRGGFAKRRPGTSGSRSPSKP